LRFRGHVTELAAALERKGHEVHVFTRLAPSTPLYQRIDGVHCHQRPFQLNSNFVDEIQDFNRSLVHGVAGLKIDPHPESVVWGVGNNFRDFEAARWMGMNGRRAAETAFTWDKIAE
jgi:hypothetical protein